MLDKLKGFFQATKSFFQVKRNVILVSTTILIASIVAYSRIYIGVHYPSDILFGSMFGILSGLGFSLLWSKIQTILSN